MGLIFQTKLYIPCRKTECLRRPQTCYSAILYELHAIIVIKYPTDKNEERLVIFSIAQVVPTLMETWKSNSYARSTMT